ncbi:MAG: single-stranded DNA-binding protein [Candidatus Yanofskybacteria bacterium]|nr:single-stranded DNA-binding protein [Candidatus Yanofskybacteria bacterium]
MNLNKVVLIGRLTQDPDSRSIPSGQSVATIRMATNRVWKDPSGQRKDATEYHTVIAWGRLADVATQYLKKGGLVMIEGRLQTRNWTDSSGVKKYITEIIAENLQLGPRQSSPGVGDASLRSPAGAAYSNESPASRGEPMADIKKAGPVKDADIPIIDENEPMNAGVEEDEMKIKEEDLPF